MFTDEALYARYSTEHDQLAFAELYKRYCEPMQRSARAWVVRNSSLPDHIADDAVQEAFVKLSQCEGRNIQQIGNWLWRVMWNCLSHEVRRESAANAGRTELYNDDGEQILDVPVYDTNVSEEPASPSILNGLSQSDRRLVEDVYLNQRSIGELAELDGVPVKTMAKRLERAIGRVRQVYSDVA